MDASDFVSFSGFNLKAIPFPVIPLGERLFRRLPPAWEKYQRGCFWTTEKFSGSSHIDGVRVGRSFL